MLRSIFPFADWTLHIFCSLMFAILNMFLYFLFQHFLSQFLSRMTDSSSFSQSPHGCNDTNKCLHLPLAPKQANLLTATHTHMHTHKQENTQLGLHRAALARRPETSAHIRDTKEERKPRRKKERQNKKRKRLQ